MSKKGFKKSGSYVNKYNVKITAQEVQTIKNLSAKVNAKRRRDLKKFEKKSNLVGVQQDYYYGKQSASLNRFTDRKHIRDYIKRLTKYSNFKSYTRARDYDYFNKYKETIINSYGKEKSRPLIEKLNSIGVRKFVDLQRQGVIKNLNYWYDSNEEDDRNPDLPDLEDDINTAIKIIDKQ